MTPRVLIHVQHLLGIGHLQRAAAIAGALRERGAKVVLATGGVRGAAGGSRLAAARRRRSCNLPRRGRRIPASRRCWMRTASADRRRVEERGGAMRVLQLFAETAPDVLLTEMYPVRAAQLPLRADTLAGSGARAGRSRR